MKILEFQVVGLFDRPGEISGVFLKDLNILTGRNGAGKTSILKLLWYIMSGNILIALQEVQFKTATIKTDQYACTVHRLSRAACKIELTVDGETTVYEDVTDDDFVVENAEDMVNPILVEKGSSVFFPTFRRIEGGFTLNKPRRGPGTSLARLGRKSDVEEALLGLSRRLSNEPHTFVSAISTVDIVGLLLRHYADLSELSNSLQQSTSQEIIERIKNYRQDPGGQSDGESAAPILDEIRATIENMEVRREQIMTPIDAVRALVERLFRHVGIKIGARLNFGDAASAVNSDELSAGEKQFLSFICYNAFYKDAIIFIDEPELSLHVDWQRQLFSVLKQQQASNQFVIATHSPFIYSKYPESEIILDPDRGDDLE